MRVGICGTGAIAAKHAHAYKAIGYRITACSNRSEEKGQRFAQETGADFVPSIEELCRRPDVDFVDLCTLPDFRLQAVEVCAENGKPILVQKPMAINCDVARQMISVACAAGIVLGVVSQHRFDDSTLFLGKAIREGRLGQILEADAHIKWYRSPEYYSRPVKGSWAGEGGGALMNQGIHQVDLLLALAGPVKQVFGFRQLGALHRIESEDVVNAVVEYASGATGVIQAATAFWPGMPERIEIHGTRGTAIITGDRLTAWNVQDDKGDAPPLTSEIASGASDPMAISTLPFERQFLDFGEAVRSGRKPVVCGEEGYRAVELVTSIYASCANRELITISS
jgi:UDP-N-acetyl-2-amino-2-deoxyglucuronate dehydrogenase